MNMQPGNFNTNIFNRFNSLNKNTLTKNQFGSSNINLNLDKALKSVDLPQHMFNNYINGRKSTMFKFLRKQYFKMKAEEYDILTDFEPKDVFFGRNLKKEKIRDIYFKTYYKHISDLSFIYRFKNYDNPAFQLYVKKNSIDDFDIIIIDLYHLVIPAPNYTLNKSKVDAIGDYNAVKDYGTDLSEIKT